ncbi:MAG TPA: nucleotide exchange factor GrpE [Gemmatimonadales bacterium]
MTRRTDLGNDLEAEGAPGDTPARMSDSAGDTGRSADGEDIASTDMSAQPSSRADDTQPLFGGGRDAELEGDLAELKDRHLRLAAEYDNYRKRSSRERAELADRAQASFVAKLLDVLDDLERLMASDPATPLPSLREGLSAVDRKLWKDLQDAGVERIDPVGTPFDPALHEAVSTVPAPDKSSDHMVSATFQPGYLFKGTLVRPARVQVYSDQGQH